MAEKDFLNPDESMDLSQGNADTGDNMVLNLDDVSDELPKFEAMPPGVYNVIVENVEYGPSKSSGNPMLTWQFKVIDEPYENRMLFFHTVLNKEFGVKMLKRTLVRVCPDIDLANFSPAKFAEEGEALGLPARIKVRVRPYQGEKRNDVQDVLPPQDADEFLNSPE